MAGFSGAFKPVSEIILSSIKFNANIPKEERTTFTDYQAEIGTKIKYFPILSDVEKYFQSSLQSNDVLIHFSSGGLAGIELINHIYLNTL